jgi:transposase
MRAARRSRVKRQAEAGTYLSQPGIGVITGARMLGEFGDAPGRYADAKARRNYAGTSPLTIASGKKKTVHARFIHNDHLVNAMHDQAFAAISVSPGARAYYDELRSREIDHTDALRRVANRLAGILHGCVKTGAAYDEYTAWGHRSQPAAA